MIVGIMQKFINSSQPTVWVAYLRGGGGRRGTAKMRGIFEVQTTHCRVKFHLIKCFPNFKKNNLNEKLFGKPWDKQSKIANAMAMAMAKKGRDTCLRKVFIFTCC